MMKKMLLLLALGWIVFSGFSQMPSEKIYIKSIESKDSFLVIPLQGNQWGIAHDSIPQNLLEKKDAVFLQDTTRPGVFYVFKILVTALNEDISDIQLRYKPAKKADFSLKSDDFTCFNIEGVDFKGFPFKKNIFIEQGRLQSLWIGVQIPADAKGNCITDISLIINKKQQSIVKLHLLVTGQAVKDGGVNDPACLAKMQWLNFADDIDHKVTKEFHPIQIQEHTIRITGRDISLGSNGLPQQIESYFKGANDIFGTPVPILTTPFRFIVELADGETIELNQKSITLHQPNDVRVEWTSNGSNEKIQLQCHAYTEFDGFMQYDIRVIGKTSNPIQVKDIRLEFQMDTVQAKYAMGMGLYGGFCPKSFDWRWDVANKNQDAIWIGNVNGGIRLKFKDENYRSPLLNIYYDFGKLKAPVSWNNSGKGGFRLNTENNEVAFSAYSGDRVIKKSDTLHFMVEMLITPTKLLDKEKMFGDRYCHPKSDFSNMDTTLNEVVRTGANIMNIHHAKDVYPYINYPFNEVNVHELKKVIDQAHQEDIRTKVYYTTREVTVNLPEFWALHSLDGEVIFPGPGNTSKTLLHEKPDQWLIDNVRESYVPAWVATFKSGRFEGKRDLSVLTTPDSRWNNFYIGGLDWMCRNLEIDGVYVDDCALDRTTIRRARKIIDKYRPQGRIDMHSCDHYSPDFAWANCLNLYMDFIPYLDLVWIGEGRDYKNDTPDNWLIEICGIPFGVSGQMLQGGGNPWRGMIYGMTNRAGWSRKGPEHIWNFWDAYHIQEKDFLGYWDDRNPVESSSKKVKATVYQGKKQHIIALASWEENPVDITLDIDWNALDINPEKAVLYAPEIINFQEKTTFDLQKSIPVEPEKGWLLIVEEI